MRVLVAQPGPQFSVQDLHVGWVEALRSAGEHVVEFNLADRLNFYGNTLFEVDAGKFKRALSDDQACELAVNGIYAALYKVRPHILLVISGFFLAPEVYARARQQGTRVVLLHTESPYQDSQQILMAGHVDLNLINDPTNIVAFSEVAPTFYLPHAYRQKIHCPGPSVPELECDLAFVGTGYPSRMRFFEQMDLDGLDVLLAGHWRYLPEDSKLRRYISHDPEECLDNERAADIYRSARVGINVYRREADPDDTAAGVSMGPREVEMAACGLFFLRDSRPESDEVLHMLPTFDGPGDASEKVRWWLKRPDERAELALKAREAVADRTFDRHAAQLLRLLSEE